MSLRLVHSMLLNSYVIKKPSGEEVAEMKRKGGIHAREHFVIEAPINVEINGDLIGHEYTFKKGDQTVATVKKLVRSGVCCVRAVSDHAVKVARRYEFT